MTRPWLCSIRSSWTRARRPFALVSAFLLLVLSTLGYAQTPTVTVNKPFSVSATHDGKDTEGYRLYLDGVKALDIPIGQLAAGVVTSQPLSVSARGSHAVLVSAYNADKESRSDPLTFQAVLPDPAKPGNLQFIITANIASDGTITGFTIKQVAE